MSFEDDLAAQVAAEFQTVDVPVTVNKQRYVIHLTQVDGLGWADEIDRHPARPDVQLDRTFGYNLRSLALAVVKKKGELFTGGERVDVTEGQWDLLLRSLDGGAIARLGEAVFALNEADRVAAVIAAGKALAAESEDSSI